MQVAPVVASSRAHYLQQGKIDLIVPALVTDAEKITLRKRVSMVFQQYNLFPHETALQVADVFYFTDGGGVVESGAPARLFDHPQHERTAAFLSRIL